MNTTSYPTWESCWCSPLPQPMNCIIAESLSKLTDLPWKQSMPRWCVIFTTCHGHALKLSYLYLVIRGVSFNHSFTPSRSYDVDIHISTQFICWVSSWALLHVDQFHLAITSLQSFTAACVYLVSHSHTQWQHDLMQCSMCASDSISTNKWIIDDWSSDFLQTHCLGTMWNCCLCLLRL